MNPLLGGLSMHRLFVAALSLLLLIGPAPLMAQEQQGVAIAQAPEAGVGICFGENAQETMACAQAECMDMSGLGEEDCKVNLWCFPHGWVVDIFMQHQEGPHWHSYTCDANSRWQIDNIVEVKCSQKGLIDCTPVQIWDFDGNEILGLVEQ
jgi:hypothetical protein